MPTDYGKCDEEIQQVNESQSTWRGEAGAFQKV